MIICLLNFNINSQTLVNLIKRNNKEKVKEKEFCKQFKFYCFFNIE